MNNDLISREALKKAFKIEELYWGKRIIDIIDNAPTIDPIFGLFKEPHGKWITMSDRYGKYVCCDKCGYDRAENKSNYCPNCGADMEGGEE